MQKHNMLKTKLSYFEVSCPLFLLPLSFLKLLSHSVHRLWEWAKQNKLPALSGNLLDGMIPSPTENVDRLKTTQPYPFGSRTRFTPYWQCLLPVLVSISVSIFILRHVKSTIVKLEL